MRIVRAGSRADERVRVQECRWRWDCPLPLHKLLSDTLPVGYQMLHGAHVRQLLLRVQLLHLLLRVQLLHLLRQRLRHTLGSALSAGACGPRPS